MTINIKGQLIELEFPKIMGVLNLTPDSFYDGGQYNTLDRAIDHTAKMLEEGATFIDVGAFSSKPGASEVNEEEEKKRLFPLLEELLRRFPDTLFSVDTYRAKIAAGCLERGVAMINDISGGQFDPNMMKTVAKHQAPYVLMHLQGKPKDMQNNPTYENVVQDVLHYFSKKIEAAHQCGINDILIDPGFGFGKTVDHNYQLLKHLDLFKSLQCPIMVGLSRKSMIYKTLGLSPHQALNGSTVLHTVALLKGAQIVRVHDVKEAKECTDLLQALR